MRFPAWLLFVLIFVAACQSAATPAATAVPPTQQQATAILPPTATPLAATEPARIPKRRDLIFVEFFGIT